MERISIIEIAAILAIKSDLKKKDAERFANMIFDVVKDGLERDRLVKIKGLGTFKVIEVESRESVNVNTGDRVMIEGYSKVTFTPDATMKELVNKPFSQFETVILNDGVDFSGIEDYEEINPESSDDEESEEEIDVIDAMEEQSISHNCSESKIDQNTLSEYESSNLLETEDTTENLNITSEEDATIMDTETVSTLLTTQPIVEIAVGTDESSEGVKNETLTEKTNYKEKTIDEETDNTEVSSITNEESTIPEKESTFEPSHTSAASSVIPDSDNDEKKSSSNYWILWMTLGLAACAASFVGGYVVGSKSPSYLSADTIIVEKTDTLYTEKSDSVNIGTDSITKANFTVSKSTPSNTNSENLSAAVLDKAMPTNKNSLSAVPSQKADTHTSVVDPSKYEAMDARVRTGAYHIVGTDYKIKVKAGETLTQISRRALGPDMECYLEVYNNLKSGSPLQEGQTIMIPKLKLKKVVNKSK